MLEINKLKEEHLEDAALLVSRRYRRLREMEPHLPEKYEDVNNLLPLLKKILNTPVPGVAAFRKNRLVGFLTGWQMSSFRGKRSTYSPEWANAADFEDSKRIYEEMYSHLAAIWLADNYVAHYISLFPNDNDVLRAWNWLGFGMIAVDAVRGLESIQSSHVDVHIRRANLQDLEQVMELHEALWEYSKGTPIFLLTERRDRNYHRDWLSGSDRVVWLACSKEETVAFMRLGPADSDACTIIDDNKTTSIFSAFTKEHVRNEGIASALLDQALKSAGAEGYERCAVSFEPMNLLGARFWLKFFKPVCLSVVRYIDERIIRP